MTGPKAKVGQPAPHWRGKAVVQDEIKEISLEDYKVLGVLVISQAHRTCLVSKCLTVNKGPVLNLCWKQQVANTTARRMIVLYRGSR